MNKTIKLILWIVVSSFVGGVIYGIMDGAHLDKTAAGWNHFYPIIIGLGIGYFVFRD